MLRWKERDERLATAAFVRALELLDLTLPMPAGATGSGRLLGRGSCSAMPRKGERVRHDPGGARPVFPCLRGGCAGKAR